VYKVLIVDDEYEIRRSLALYYPWGDAGFVVAGQEENGEAARDFVRKNHVDLVLCDIKMPVLSGLELARWVHEQGLPLKIVLLSAYRKFDFAQEALRYGVKRYLVKPPDFAAMASCLKEIREELDREARNVPETDAVIDAVMAYTVGNAAEATLREAARLVGMNPHYLSTYIRDRTGHTFSQQLIQVKMERATVLLRDRRNSVLAVAEALGYSSPKNFSRAFRAFHGMSPGRFRHPRPA
jgi:YesN/AraC family two-component response regulator